MEENFKNLIGGLDKIKLSRDERSFTLSKVLNKPIPSPYFKYLNNKFIAFGTPVFLVIFIFAGVTVFANSALPGDLLYPVKVKVTEPIVDVSQISPEAKADWEEVKAVRRIDEAVKLSDQGKLTPKNTRILEKNFKSHVDSFNTAKDNIATSSEGKNDINSKFKNKIKDRAREAQEGTQDSSKKDHNRDDLKKFMKDVEGDMEDR